MIRLMRLPGRRVSAFIGLLCLLLFSCSDEPPNVIEDPAFPGLLRMSVEYRSSYELGMRCGSADTGRPILLRIICEPKRIAFNFTCFGTDTVIILRGLSRATPYEVTLLRKTGDATRDSLPPLAVRTLDVAPRGFRWEEIKIGQPPSGLNDVWVGSDSCIYAVGHDLGDPLQGLEKLGHIARWDGHQWNIENREIPTGELWSVFGFSESDVWIGSTHVYHFDGKKWTDISKKYSVYAERDIIDIWGNRPGNVWFVGGNGSILHWDGMKLTSMHESPNIGFAKVTGSSDSVAYATSWSSPYYRALWRNKEGGWYPWMGIEPSNPSEANMKYHMVTFLIGGGPLWCDETGTLMVGGKYLYRYRYGKWSMVGNLEGNVLSHDTPWGGFSNMSGNSSADYFMLSYQGMLYHFNGADFSIELPTWNPSDPTSFTPGGLSVKGNTVCIGATIFDPINRALLIVGRR